MTNARKILADNLAALMSQSPEINSVVALERATANRGSKVGKSTVQRVLACETTVNLDYVESFAKVFHIQAWQLLHPTMGMQGGSTAAAPSISSAVAAVVDALATKDIDERKRLVLGIEALAASPGDQIERDYVLAKLSQARVKPAAETHMFAGKPPLQANDNNRDTENFLKD